jgi:hypothetical protein
MAVVLPVTIIARLFGTPITPYNHVSRPLTPEEDLRVTVMALITALLFTVFVTYSIFKHLSLASDVNKRSSSMDTTYSVTPDSTKDNL